jgi:hypothetical protein
MVTATVLALTSVASNVTVDVDWPLSLFLAPLQHDAQSYIVSANRNYTRSVREN